MTQANLSLAGSDSGSALVSKVNARARAVNAQHRGSARPIYAEPGLIWVKEVDAATDQIMLFDGAADIVIGVVDRSAGVFSAAGASGGGSDATARDLVAFQALSGLSASGTLGRGYAWALDSDEWGATSTNEVYRPNSRSYANPAGAQAIPGADGTPIGSLTNGGGLAAAFDGDIVQTYQAAAWIGDHTGFVGKDWGVARTVSRVDVTSPSNVGTDGGSPPNSVAYAVKGSDSTPSYGGGVTLASGLWGEAETSETLSITNVDTDTAYRHHWLELDNTGNNNFVAIAEVEFFEAGSAGDMELVTPEIASNFLSVTAPNNLHLYALWKDDSGVGVLESHLSIGVTRDGGAGTPVYVSATPRLVGAFDGDFKLIAATADVSAQTTGVSPRARLVAAAGVSQQVGKTLLIWE